MCKTCKREREKREKLKKEICEICHKAFGNKKVIELACGKIGTRRQYGHCYHKSCLAAWFKISRTCPKCRAFVTLHNAAKASDITLLQLLLSCGVYVDDEDTYGRTALYYASSKDIKKLLLDAGADESKTVIDVYS